MPPPPPGHTWNSLMRLALEEARLAAENGDIPVGALIAAPDGAILAKAGNRVEMDHNPAAHAEILAIKKACAQASTTRLAGAVLVTTLEPCLMCAGAIAHARICGVVYGAADARAGAIASAASLEDLPMGGRSFWHMGGIYGSACERILRDFFRTMRLKTQ